MLKKSDILALLDHLPEEFEPLAFQDQFDALVLEQVPSWQVDAACKTLERVRREGSSPVEEVEARFNDWAKSFE
ncbi:MAG: hypothetical protein KDB07_00230 [Planctomycetes bacterium]|nr:hypothetical protein [Planctomycetota bacterium]